MKPLTLARDLHRRRARDRTGLFLAEGVRSIEDLLASPVRVKSVLVSRALAATQRGAALGTQLADAAAAGEFELLELAERELASAATTETPQGVVAIAEQPRRSLDDVALGPSARIMVLDGVQDPGNVGTIIRTAEALGASATVALGGSAELWNPKVVRGAMGSLFRHVALATSAEELLGYCTTRGVSVWAAAASGESLARIPRPGAEGPQSGAAGAPERLAIVVGNEGHGVSSQLASAADRTVAIPIRGPESLNVAVAAGILLYTLSPLRND